MVSFYYIESRNKKPDRPTHEAKLVSLIILWSEVQNVISVPCSLIRDAKSGSVPPVLLSLSAACYTVWRLQDRLTLTVCMQSIPTKWREANYRGNYNGDPRLMQKGLTKTIRQTETENEISEWNRARWQMWISERGVTNRERERDRSEVRIKWRPSIQQLATSKT